VLSDEDQSNLHQLQQHLGFLASSVLHINSARPAIQSVYSSRESRGWVSEEVPYLLANDDLLLDEVSAWFDTMLGLSGLTTQVAAFAFRLTLSTGSAAINLANAGRGTQAVLPVVALLIAIVSRRVEPSLVIIEEPEAHLHPSAHGALADLIIQASAVTQIIVETHSENLILRMRRRIADGSMAQNRLQLTYVTEDHEVLSVAIDGQGGASNWPAGVFESDVEEATAIMEAKLQTMRSGH